ncbi:uncharacterized protein LOC132714586 [Ruditapes philippinarum]|uniref:uncharacterized protein LOC132714586 n=1 Tax=Ruditapes philippinarum TaxID=129788 RepID=UPI00295B5647|nr:uncharacterized protein LOC132714586 [Ruditapes philippinarum]
MQKRKKTVSKTRSVGNRQKRYNETTKHCSRDVVQKTSINKYKDDSSRCDIGNTPLLDVRCGIKNTPPLDVELNQDERIGVPSLAEPDQTTGYNTMYIKSGEENMLDATHFISKSKDQNSKYKADDDNETTPIEPKETEKQTAVHGDQNSKSKKTSYVTDQGDQSLSSMDLDKGL